MNTTKTMAVVLCGLLLPTPTDAQAGSEANRRGPDVPADQLRMVLEETEIRVSNGSPFDPCAILLGLEGRNFTLPGGATLRLKPLAVLVRGKFDERGSFSLDIAKQLTGLSQPITVLVQAITVIQDSESFATSNVLTLGMATSGGRTDPVPTDPKVDPVPVDADDTDRVSAIDR